MPLYRRYRDKIHLFFFLGIVSFTGKPGYFIAVITEVKDHIPLNSPVSIQSDQRLVEQLHALLGAHTNSIRQLEGLSIPDKISDSRICQHDLNGCHPSRAVSFRHERLTKNTEKQ